MRLTFLVFGSGCGGVGVLLDNAKKYWDSGVRVVSPWTIPHMLVDSPSGMVAIQFGIRGPNTAVVSACATGSHAIGEAAETIIRGQADLMLGAGTEAALVPLAFAGFGQMRALGTPIDPKLPKAGVDLILVVDVYHEFSHPEHMLKAMRAALKPEGRVALAEFRLEDPNVPIKLLHKMSKEQINKELPPNGFKLVEQYDELPWQHVMFFERAE